MQDAGENALGRPLLSKLDTRPDRDMKWPVSAAERSKLYVPESWKTSPYQEDCVIRFDASKKVLLVIATKSGDNNDNDEEERVLDVIDSRDIVGAEIELQLFGSDFASDDRNIGFRNEKAKLYAVDDDDDDINLTGEMKKSSITDISQLTCTDIFNSLKGDVERVFNVTNIEGACTTDCLPYDSEAIAFLNIYCYPRRRPSTEGYFEWIGLKAYAPPLCNPNPPPLKDDEVLGKRYAQHRRLAVVASQDFSDVTSLVRAIRRVANIEPTLLHTKTARPKKYLVIVNPVSGTKQGETIYRTTVKPMLEQSGVEHDLLVTTKSRHAEEHIKEVKAGEEADITDYDGIIAMGGDGILCEILSGIKARKDAADILKLIEIGIVGCGTSNGLAMSLLHECGESFGALESTFLICKGKTSRMDLSNYSTHNKKYTSFLTFSWALIAEVDIESEVIRCLGVLRNEIWSVLRMLTKRTYKARFSYLPASKVPEHKTKGIHASDMPALTEDVPSNWETIEDDFIMFWASHVTHAASNTYHSPHSKIQDGVFQILVIRNPCSRYELTKVLLALERGTHVNYPKAEFIECVAYRLEPLTSGSFNDLDGEVIESGPIQAYVQPAVVQIFSGTQ